MPDLTHLKPGDKIAINNRGNSFRSHIPNVSYELFTITRTTETQIVAKNKNGNEARFRRKDGAQVGENYINAVEATPDLLEDYKAQVSELKRRLGISLKQALMKGLVNVTSLVVEVELPSHLQYSLQAWMMGSMSSPIS